MGEAIRITCKGHTTLPIEALQEFQGELKSLNKDNYLQLKKSILQEGFCAPVFVWEGHNKILDGHQRLRTVKQMILEGYECDALPVDFIEADNEMAARRKLLKAYLPMYGHIEEEGLYEFSLMAEMPPEEIAMLPLPGIDSKEFIKGYFIDDPHEYGCDEDEVPEVTDTVCKPGDLWILGNHRLLCGDSTNVQHVERLMGGEKADMVFTDPPYGVGYEYNSHDDNVTEYEHIQFLLDISKQAFLFSERMIITPGCNNLAHMFKVRNDYSHVGCWTKTNAMSPGRVTHFWTWEPIFFYGKFKRKRGNDVFNYPVGKQPDTGDHTCPKPIALWQDIVENFSEPKDRILDFFLGSGSTLIACEKTNRRCFGIEIDPHYCDVIIARWEKFSNQKAVNLNPKPKTKIKMKNKKPSPS